MTLGTYQHVDDALLAFWTDKAAALIKHANYKDAAARGNGHLNRVAEVLADICQHGGAPASDVAFKKGDRRLLLPGFYRPTKEWDVTVWKGGRPIVAIELKSQVGPSFSNNANNRAAEAAGDSFDLDRATRATLIPGGIWTGFAFIIEDCPASRQVTTRPPTPLVPTDPVFKDWTYMGRASILCQRLQADGRFNATWAVGTTRPPNYDWHDLAANVSWRTFRDSLLTHLGNHYP